MVKNVVTAHAVPSLLAAFAAVMAASLAVAQEKVPEVKIEAARTVKVVGRTASGAPIEVVQLSRRINYSDLDLSTESGANELQARVKHNAEEACKELDRLYPLGTTEGPGKEGKSCVKDAIDGAMVQARAAVDAAKTMRSAKAPG